MPNMIDSEIKWLGDIAESYQLKALKYCMTLEGKGSYPASFGEAEGTYPFFTSGQKKLFCEEYEYDGEYILIGDGGTFNATYVNGKFSASDHTLVYKVNKGVSTQFVHKFLNAHEESLDKITFKGMGMRNIQRPLLEKIPLPLPDLATQQRIAAFLDARTAKIDSLSDELTKFKANLQLQKRSLVSECVTKGIPRERDRAYKNSGLSYIGDIPVKWDLVPNKFLLKLIKNKVGAKASQYKMLSLTKRGVIVRDISEGKGKFSASNEGYQVIEPNDLVFCLFDIEETPRTVGLARDTGIITNAYSAFKTTELVNPEYINYLYHSIDDRKLLKPFYSGLRNTIRPPVFGTILSPVPPINEQQRIADYLDVECARIDALIGEIDNQVNLLKTYRKSLINEVVTGKVGV